MVQKMILAKEEMASQIKRHGEIQTLQKVREIVEIVCQVLNKTTDMMNVTSDAAHMQDIMLLCPDITQEQSQTRMKIHFTHAKGIHLLHAKESTQQQHGVFLALSKNKKTKITLFMISCTMYKTHFANDLNPI